MRDAANIIITANGTKLPETASDAGKPIALDASIRPAIAKIEQIAVGLTDKQQEGLLNYNWLGAAQRKSLVAKGLISIQRVSYRSLHVTLTPMGKAVREYLRGAKP